MGKPDLIKTVRGLDQSGPGDNGEKLGHLWECLVASADSQFHAAEESSLRWLLKTMNGATPAAETLRRYPLTWTILGCVFQRIPLFSLAKSLADRRFIGVLQQSLKDVSMPTAETSVQQSPKRKRPSPKSFSLDELRPADGCIESGQAIFEALRCLLQRIDDTTLSAHDRIGAEHLKSLFGTSATEAAVTAAPALWICDILLGTGHHAEEVEGCEEWLGTISSIWGLHLQGSDDTSEIATNLFGPAVRILNKLEELPCGQDLLIPQALRHRWSSDLQKFMHQNFILPARASFLNHQAAGAVVMALEVSKQNLDIAAPVLYFLASGATEMLALRGVRKGNAEWMKRVFQAVDASIKGRDDRPTITNNVLQRARQLSMPVDTKDLQSVCRQSALREEETDWTLVANLGQCDPDIFQGEGSGAELLAEVCTRSLGNDALDENKDAILEVIEAIIRGFRTARDSPAFLKLWFQQLCEIERRKLKSPSPWAIIDREQSKIFVQSWIEQELSPRQLLGILEWAEAQETRPKALCLWLNAVSQGLRSDDFKDIVGQRLFDLVLTVSKSSTDATALKWRVVSRAIAWAPITKRAENWDKVKDSLKKILKKSPIASAETYEAFKCCCRLWVSLTPDGSQIHEVVTLVENFTSRLSDEFASPGVTDEKDLQSCLDSAFEAEFREESALQQYLAWFLRGPTRLNRLYFDNKSELLPAVQQAVADTNTSSPGLELVWSRLLNNEHDINETKMAGNLVDRAVSALRQSGTSKRWPGEHGQLWMRMMLGVPLDAITRPQRERMMTLLMETCASKESLEAADLNGLRLILSLATRLMARPTFYEGMRFQHLVDVADTMSNTLSGVSTDNEIQLEIIERYSSMASATIKQMAEHVEERSINYFSETADIISRCKDAAVNVDGGRQIPPLHLTLLKALASELSRSGSCRNHSELGSLASDAQLSLGHCVASVMGQWVGDKKLFTKPHAGADFRLLAAVDAAQSVDELPGLQEHKSSSLRKLDKRSQEAMQADDLRGWKIQTFLQTHLASSLEVPRPATFRGSDNLRQQGRDVLLKDYVGSIVSPMSTILKMQYLEALIGEYHGGCDTEGQLVAIQHVVDQLIMSTDVHNNPGDYDLSAAHGDLTRALASARTTTNSVYICRILYSLLERKPQMISQWNVEYLLSCIATLSSGRAGAEPTTPFVWQCKLVEVVIKKHRLRLEGHQHILLATMQPLLRNLIREQREDQSKDGPPQDSKASAFSRLVTLVCEPTAGAVSRAQHHSALDSATDAAKRSAGRHMYLVLMQYVKLQLETDVSRAVREALEPAMNSIFDITPPEGRKILNDAMDASGRAILREMFKRYTRFGKWSGV